MEGLLFTFGTLSFISLELRLPRAVVEHAENFALALLLALL